MCVFPKRYQWSTNEPSLFPFAGTPPRDWDRTRFNPAFFPALERRVLDLQKLGIEADLILFHPYDGGHWGFDRMTANEDDRYEGNLPKRWGNLSAEELVQRFWQATIAGTYATHGETYLHPDNKIWWATGGE